MLKGKENPSQNILITDRSKKNYSINTDIPLPPEANMKNLEYM